MTAAPRCLDDKRVALVIGNGAYKNTAALTNPPNDAADVAEALKAIGFEVTLKIDLEKRQMDQAVAQFAREGKGADAVLFYYAPGTACSPAQELPHAGRRGGRG